MHSHLKTSSRLTQPTIHRIMV